MATDRLKFTLPDVKPKVIIKYPKTPWYPNKCTMPITYRTINKI